MVNNLLVAVVSQNTNQETEKGIANLAEMGFFYLYTEIPGADNARKVS